MPDLFSPVAFFILLREAIEAGIIIAVLLGFAEQIMVSGPAPALTPNGGGLYAPIPNKALNTSHERLLRRSEDGADSYGTAGSRTPIEADQMHEETALSAQEGELRRRDVIRRMKFEIWAGALAGGATALALGSAILVVFYLKLHDVWQSAEQLWEGIFCAIASFLILIMGLAFLRMDHARVKWRIKLSESFEASSGNATHTGRSQGSLLLFWLPFVTVLREGLEGIVFMGGVSLTETPSSIPLAAVTGIVVGAGISRLLYSTASGQTLHTFLTTSTCLLFLIGAGLASRATGFFEQKYYIQHVGLAAAESGNGPGSFRVAGNVWAMPWGNPEPGAEGTSGFYQLANSLVGWNSIATFWTITTYILYWVFIIGYLVRRKYIEGRTSILGRVSARGIRRQQAKAAGFEIERDEHDALLGDSDDELERNRVTDALDEQAFLRVLRRAKRGDNLGNKISTAMAVINGAIEELGEPAVAMSFNGGKDCTVLVHLLATVLFTRHNAVPENLQIGSISPAEALAQDERHDAPKPHQTEPPFISDPVAPPPPIHGRTASAPCKATHHHQRKPGTLYPPIRSVYITAPYPFEEMEEFVLDSVQVYNLDLWRFGGGMKAALEEYLKCDGGKDVRGVLVGTRRGDPNGVSVPIIAQTDPSWPQFLRIHPILHWNYKDIWDFLKELNVPWCSLYDCGYTSVGSTNNSFPNPLLKNSSAPSGWNPGWMLEDASQERAGRSDRRD